MISQNSSKTKFSLMT